MEALGGDRELRSHEARPHDDEVAVPVGGDSRRALKAVRKCIDPELGGPSIRL
jgi:hypothetical protein